MLLYVFLNACISIDSLMGSTMWRKSCKLVSLFLVSGSDATNITANIRIKYLHHQHCAELVARGRAIVSVRCLTLKSKGMVCREIQHQC